MHKKKLLNRDRLQVQFEKIAMLGYHANILIFVIYYVLRPELTF